MVRQATGAGTRIDDPIAFRIILHRYRVRQRSFHVR